MQKKFIPCAVFFVILLIVLAHYGAKLSVAPTFAFAQEQKEIYLTFDDGPSTKVTNRILDILKEEDVKATFFIVSDRAETRTETLRRIAQEGHTLGVHSKSHEYSEIYASDEALMRDVDACAAFIERTVGVTPHVYRFPGGGTRFRERQTKLLENKGYRVVGWNAVCGDEEIPGASEEILYETAVKTSASKKPVVLLLHDSATHMATANALPRIIAHFREAGYVFRAF